MADNVAITAGSGVTVASDEVTINAILAQVQRIKVVLGTDGNYQADLANGQATMANSLPVTIASDQSAVLTDHAATVVTLYNVTLTSANTEYSQALPATCRRLAFQCRSSKDVRFAYVTGKVATPTAPYFTLKASAGYDSGTIKLASGTLYLGSATAGVIMEIEAWS